MRFVNQYGLFFCMSFLGVLFTACSSEERLSPNIVLILADDLGYGDVGSYNHDSKISTPHIDHLASEGISFTDAHTPSSVCTPTRYGLLTGRYCWRTRLKKGVILGYDEDPLIDSNQATIASLLQDRGYTTACIGKWHLGMRWPTKNDYVIKDDHNQYNDYSGPYRENEENIDFGKPLLSGPLDVGFDYFFGTQGCSTGDPPYCFIENNQAVAIPTILSPDSLTRLPGFAPGLMVSDWSEETVDITFTEKAIKFIEHHLNENEDKPFFLYLALSSPHLPWLAPEFAKGKSEEGPRGDLVTVVDWSVDQISTVLDQYHLSEHTLFIFTSDNGPRKGSNGHLSAGPFRGYKGSIWEGGHRVPFIARWPGRIKPGTLNDETISLTDMFATLDYLTNETQLETETEDGYNVWPAFIGQDMSDSEKSHRIFHSAAGQFAIRQGPWKLIEAAPVQADASHAIDSNNQRGELFNLETDPAETINLWDEHPELVRDLQRLLENQKHAQ